MTTTDKPSLRECPFCGSEAVQHERCVMDSSVYCCKCTCRVYSNWQGKGDSDEAMSLRAIAAWNTRAQPPLATSASGKGAGRIEPHGSTASFTEGVPEREDMGLGGYGEPERDAKLLREGFEAARAGKWSEELGDIDQRYIDKYDSFDDFLAQRSLIKGKAAK